MRRYIFVFLVSIGGVIAPAAILNFYFEGGSGDLTRVGGYAERHFGWNSFQPSIKINENSQEAPDVLVLGDSFSASNLWQSVIEGNAKIKILSFHYNSASCIDDWVRFSLSSASAKTVIIQTAERIFVHRFKSVIPCKASKIPQPINVKGGVTADVRARWPTSFNFIRSYRIFLNSMKMNSGVDIHGPVFNKGLVRGCAKFSNVKSEKILYYHEDEGKYRWSRKDIEDSVGNIKKISRVVKESGKNFIFILVPDKSHVYKNCMIDRGVDFELADKLEDLLVKAGVEVPDLVNEFMSSIDSVEDLYFPNDSHLSSSGYVMLAKQVQKVLY